QRAGGRRGRRRRGAGQRRAGQLARHPPAGRGGAGNFPGAVRREPSPRVAARGLGSVRMKILVANLGSTSFKYRLFDMAGERVLARGGVERIGSERARCYIEAGGVKDEAQLEARDHAVAVRLCLQQLSDPKLGCLKDPSELAAIGFKAVHAQGLTGVQRVDDRVLAAMEAYNDVAPAHNPPYVRAMRLLAKELPQRLLVAAFETGFQETIAKAERLYAVPLEWAEQHGIKKWGFHGASHRYIGQRTAALLGDPDVRIISCHLGGSSSLCAIQGGKSRANSL